MTGSTGLSGSNLNNCKALHTDLIEKILRWFYSEYNLLCHGSLEEVY